MGKYHTVLLLTNGSVATFGGNSSGQLARTSSTQSFKPVLDSGESILQIGAVRDLTFILTTKSLFVAGWCDLGLCGAKTGQIGLTRLVTVPNPQRALFFDSSVVIIDQMNQFFVVGANNYGQLCGSTTSPFNSTWTMLSNQIRDVRMSSNSTLLLFNNGTLAACGAAFTTSGIISYPMTITKPIGKIIDIAATSQGWLALTTSGLYAIGNNSLGGLGFGTRTTRQYNWVRVGSAYGADTLFAGTAQAIVYANYEIKYAEEDSLYAGFVVCLVLFLLTVASIFVYLIARCCKRCRLNPKVVEMRKQREEARKQWAIQKKQRQEEQARARAERRQQQVIIRQPPPVPIQQIVMQPPMPMFVNNPPQVMNVVGAPQFPQIPVFQLVPAYEIKQ